MTKKQNPSGMPSVITAALTASLAALNGPAIISESIPMEGDTNRTQPMDASSSSLSTGRTEIPPTDTAPGLRYFVPSILEISPSGDKGFYVLVDDTVTESFSPNTTDPDQGFRIFAVPSLPDYMVTNAGVNVNPIPTRFSATSYYELPTTFAFPPSTANINYPSFSIEPPVYPPPVHAPIVGAYIVEQNTINIDYTALQRIAANLPANIPSNTRISIQFVPPIATATNTPIATPTDMPTPTPTSTPFTTPTTTTTQLSPVVIEQVAELYNSYFPLSNTTAEWRAFLSAFSMAFATILTVGTEGIIGNFFYELLKIYITRVKTAAENKRQPYFETMEKDLNKIIKIIKESIEQERGLRIEEVAGRAEITDRNTVKAWFKIFGGKHIIAGTGACTYKFTAS